MLIDLTGEKPDSTYFRNRLAKRFRIDPAEKCKVILPELTLSSLPVLDFRFSNLFLEGLDLEWNEYGVGRYLGSKNNPYLFLYDVEEGAEELVVHPDTLFVNYKTKGRRSLRRVEFSSKECYVAYDAFAGCPDLEEVVFKNSEKVFLCSRAFSNAKKLAKVVFDENGEYRFYEKCFYGDESLSEFTFPKKTYEVVGKNAFVDCGFKKIYLPASVTQLEASFSEDVEVYYEGDCAKLITGSYEYESSGNYGWSFHRSAGSFDSSTEYRYADSPKYHSFVSYEEFKSLS